MKKLTIVFRKIGTPRHKPLTEFQDRREEEKKVTRTSTFYLHTYTEHLLASHVLPEKPTFTHLYTS